MNMVTKNNIFERYLSEYLGAGMKRKSAILDHVVDVTQMHRKAAIRKFHALQLCDAARPEQRGRSVYYTKDVDAALRTLWEAANQPCGELLHPMIPEYVAIFRRDKLWSYDESTTTKLLEMGLHTVRRRASNFEHIRTAHSGISSTKPSLLKTIIPIFKGPWKNLPPGHGQLDTVAHCGHTLLGDFAYTVNYTDAATYWIIPRAQWNKGQEATLKSMKTIKEQLPVVWLGAHPDTGSEFINWVAKQWCEAESINLSRSEPGKKNDNMYVEERNGHVIRKYLGYARLDCPNVVPAINELFDVLGLYLNHFQAVRRTLVKERIGAKYRRVYEKIAQTPYQRMLNHATVPEEVKARLRKEHGALNPLFLKRKIDMLISKIMKIQRDYGNKK